MEGFCRAVEYPGSVSWQADVMEQITDIVMGISKSIGVKLVAILSS
jgi:hypothetical protein